MISVGYLSLLVVKRSVKLVSFGENEEVGVDVVASDDADEDTKLLIVVKALIALMSRLRNVELSKDDIDSI